MPADQAAGLRRRRAQQPPPCVHCFFDTADSTVRLAQALHRRGRTSLLIDACGRVFSDAPRSLFDWKQQLGRGQLHTLPMPYGEGWYAPGIQGDEPALMAAARGHDCIVFDARLNAPDWTPLPGAAQVVILEVNATHASMLQGYALLKTLFHSEVPISVGLLGNAAACDQLLAACKRFLDPAFTQTVYSVAHEDDAFAALAVRMTYEETGLTARYKTESTGNMALKHGC
ncbi:hypothetical protein [Thiobacillus denitrificans]|uniref:Uncharacterized protein n=1 Tax=Thiobacillus denitrificans TaxID=36861 RepID=A0A106BIG3_THIDE|nr:hypothetical protein [Thiobacillus denitrificans]KVW93050.1 hypothetical protein ABW22_15130 [Thiobacillus denitrificans]